MKKIEAVIRASKFFEVKEALKKMGILFFTYSDVKGVGNQAPEKAVYRGVEYDLGSIARIKMEIVVSEKVDEVIKCIVETCKTGELGDGKIFVYDIEDCVRIRTGERGIPALQ
ncbi:MAG: P-II family nitrogen regulator [Cytophagaceae bacterium]|jgi:nitrogen regulatory protein P-II 1|nr:P-II family nitrogen regulator [Cytophagaceae bacterium]